MRAALLCRFGLRSCDRPAGSDVAALRAKELRDREVCAVVITLTGFARRIGRDGDVLRARLQEYQCLHRDLYVPSGRTLAAEVPPEMLRSVEQSTMTLSRYTIEDGVVTSVETGSAL